MVITAQVYAMNRAAALPAEIVADLAAGAIGAALFYSRRTAETFAALAAPQLERRERGGDSACFASPKRLPNR